MGIVIHEIVNTPYSLYNVVSIQVEEKQKKIDAPVRAAIDSNENTVQHRMKKK